MVSSLAILPARWESSRFPGKPLELIMGSSLIQRAYENAKQCEALDRVVVATDDQRIFDHVTQFGGEVIMTGVCPTGTDRLVDAIRKDGSLGNYDCIVNLQGDEPCVKAETVSAVVEALHADPEAVVATPVAVIENQCELSDHAVVKCVVGLNGRALYFSRIAIPYGNGPVYRHLGLYAYRPSFLSVYSSLGETPLQQREDLEQLKVLEHGYPIAVAVVNDQSIGVNTPEDIKRVETYLCSQNTSLSLAGSSQV